MKYVKKTPSQDKELSIKLISEGWTKLKEPPNLTIATLLSLPFAFINGIIFMAIAFYLYPPLGELFNNENGFSIKFTINLFTLIYAIIIFIFMAIHEFLHACFIPNVLNLMKYTGGLMVFLGLFTPLKKSKRADF